MKAGPHPVPLPADWERGQDRDGTRARRDRKSPSPSLSHRNGRGVRRWHGTRWDNIGTSSAGLNLSRLNSFSRRELRKVNIGTGHARDRVGVRSQAACPSGIGEKRDVGTGRSCDRMKAGPHPVPLPADWERGQDRDAGHARVGTGSRPHPRPAPIERRRKPALTPSLSQRTGRGGTG